MKSAFITRSKITVIGLLATTLLGGFYLDSARAASSYPDKPVKLDVMYPPGGATDFQARIATMLAGNKEFLGQPMVIVNKTGAGGMTGWNEFVTSAKPDG